MRKMIGGATLYLDGTSFAILDEGEIWFKADAETDTIWDAEGCERFSMTFKDGRVDTMNYRRGPSDVYDEPEAKQRWTKRAVGAGVRDAAKKKQRKKQAFGTCFSTQKPADQRDRHSVGKKGEH